MMHMVLGEILSFLDRKLSYLREIVSCLRRIQSDLDSSHCLIRSLYSKSIYMNMIQLYAGHDVTVSYTEANRNLHTHQVYWIYTEYIYIDALLSIMFGECMILLGAYTLIVHLVR